VDLASVALTAARKVFADGTEALAGVDLTVRDGELMVLVGPSGCGKTTALRAVAGLEQLTSGSVTIDGADVGEMPPGERDVAMVFQNYALYPNMSVARNISFGLRARGASRDEQERRVREIAKVLDIEPLLDRKPRMLSGGQRQRVAMGRAIVRDPRVFLMDEPLSNLDARLRVQMRGEIVRIQAELGTTTIYVTHDQVEAMTMGQRVAVMDDGRIRQCDTPGRLYEAPADVFVARFMGSPPVNLVEGRIESADGQLAVVLGNLRLTVPSALAATRPTLASYADRAVTVGVRPDAFELGAAGANGGLPGVVYLAELLGSETLVHVELEGLATRITGRFGGRSGAQPGDRVSVEVDPGQLDFFDPETGLALERGQRR
jgi:multiple sugar transport system ATP-binding protein